MRARPLHTNESQQRNLCNSKRVFVTENVIVLLLLSIISSQRSTICGIGFEYPFQM